MPGEFHRSSGTVVSARFNANVTKDYEWWVRSVDEQYRFDAQPVSNNVWVGSFGAAFNKKALEQYNIKYVLTVAADMVEFTPALTDESQPPFLEHGALEVYDTEEDVILEHLEEALQFIDECRRDPRGGEILVHCIAGVSRSVTVVIAYLMTRQRMTLLEALNHVRAVREVATPNENFMAQLAELERCHGNVKEAWKAHMKACE